MTKRNSWITTYLLIAHALLFSGSITINYGKEKEFPTTWNLTFTSRFEEEALFTSTISPRSYPFFVLLVEAQQGYDIICGGSLITPRHVLTAGHCASSIQELLRAGKNVEAWINPYNRDQFQGQIAYVIDIQRHKNFLPRPYLHHDIAIATLEAPLTLSSSVSVICIGTGDYDGHDAALIGFGNYDCYSESSHMRIAEGSVLNSTNCKATGHKGKLLDTHVCATLYDAKGQRAEQAQGDSGGPLFYERKGFLGESLSHQGNCPFVQIALVSYNFVMKGKKDLRGEISNPCPNLNIPGTYTRVGAYKDFIRAIAPQAQFWE